MADSGRQVMNAQGVTYHEKEAPQNVLKAFPGALTDTSNGSISFSVDEKAIKREGGKDLPLSQLVGFRQFLKNHIDAIKIAIHSRLRKRVNNMELIV